ncbi:DUF2059 domain-containing protein [Mesorhizobium loti]|uniref:DUF2059 domain-containing protein n=1 Tax=Mesorhizobium loti R88b TaxID=935548 RepID=A0A6M7WRB9_RHILI|nr:DUF2059 domain-containing protein [Mesorhizobium loti]QKD03189.1 DUF2059 domain-containing protein [Mesorhizobium loti R88b]
MTSFVRSLTRLALALCCLVFLTMAAPAQTISDINKANGFHEMLMGIGPGFTAAVTSAPGMPPQKVRDALAAAMEGAFDPNKMEAAIETRMADKLTAKELSDLASFYASPLGKQVTALEIQAAAPQAREAKKIEGAKILGELPSRDPARLALYKKIMDDLSAVDTGEAVALNMGYAMLSEMLGAAGKPLPDDQIMALLRKQTEGLRRNIDTDVMESAAYIYRDLPLADLKLYEDFLASPAGNHYYDQMQVALGAVMTDEARSFGHRFFVALGYRKA